METTKDCLINRIDKVIISGQNIFVLDQKSQKVLHFSIDGKYFGQLGKRGKGPGEYLELLDIEVDRDRELVYVLDVRKIHIYSISGKYLKSITTEFFGSKLHIPNSNEFIFYGASRSDRILITDSVFNLKKSLFPYTLAHRLDPGFPFSNYANSTVFHISNCDTLYSYQEEIIKPKFYLDFYGKNFTANDFESLSEGEKNNLFDYLLKGGKYARCTNFLTVQNHACMMVLYSNVAYWGIYNLNTHNHTFVNYKNIKNDIFGTYVYYSPSGVTDTGLAIAVQADKLTHDKSNSFYIKHKDNLSGLNENSNPILLLAKMKI